MTSEKYDNLPNNVKQIVDTYDDNGDHIKQCKQMISELEEIGWTGDYDFSGWFDCWKNNSYIVTNIQWDGGDDLPKEMIVQVPDHITDDYDKVEFISDLITNETGYCHKGFCTEPEIKE